MLLAGLGVLRAGAATVRVVTDREVARHVAIALPEALVAVWATDPGDQVESLADDADCILIGPGTDAPEQSAAILPTVVKVLSAGGATVVFDAGALDALDPASIEPIASCTVLMPNPVEVCRLMGVDLDDVQRDANGWRSRPRRSTAARWRCAAPRPGSPPPASRPTSTQAATQASRPSGSGDVLAGLLAGFAVWRGPPRRHAVGRPRARRRR